MNVFQRIGYKPDAGLPRAGVSFFLLWFLMMTLGARAQSPLAIYTDHLVNGFQDWSWGGDSLTNSSPVHSGTGSVKHNGGAWNGLSFEHPDFNATLYSSLTFWANGGSGGQIIQVYAQTGTNDSGAASPVAFTLTSAWQQFTVSLSALGIANASNVSRLTFQLTGNGATGAFYLDDIQLTPKSAPALVHLGVDASHSIRAADARWFGVNTATWDGHLGDAVILPSLREMGCLALRWPGGSTSDTYHWAADISGNGRFMNLATNLGAQVFITVNYGSGSTNEAANWVKYFNVTNHCAFKYWEIGNENYGTWETDTNNPPNDPYTYATLAKNYIAAMKAADPSIKIGVVVVPGEDASVNNMNHSAVNPRTGVSHYGWTPVMLSTLKSLNVIPDFAVYHFYPQYTAADWPPNSPDSDPLLLQVSENWANDSSDIRQQISDYMGDAGTNIELVCTENNSDAGRMGRQSTSIVNALYLADSLSHLMKTEFNAYLWWDLHNGADTGGDFDPTLYGWRNNGDYGLFNESNSRYPTFYAEKLLQWFVRPGDTVLNASSDSLLLSAYAARKSNGAMALLVINKTPTNVLTAGIAFTNFTPSASAIVRSFGILQDEATRTNGPAAFRDIATNWITSEASVFTDSFPPYSLTLLTFAPSAPSLVALPAAAQPAGKVVFQLQGQAGTRYVIESSTNLTSWVRSGTNNLSSSSLNLTNDIETAPRAQFWRAIWEPGL